MATPLISGIKFTTLPTSYIRPESERPNLREVGELESIPIVDLGCEDRTLIIKQIGAACENYGFFQVINHQVSKEGVEKVVGVGHELFNLPIEEKMKLYSDDPTKATRLATSANVKKESIHHWRDYLWLHCHPLDKCMPEWPSIPSSFKEIVGRYSVEVRELGLRLEEMVLESLGLEKEWLKDALGEQQQHMAMSYYPPCPQPDLTFGVAPHTDPNVLTVLLQDMQVEGLQVLKDAKWYAIKPEPNAFVINVGDQLQALSNGKYKSAWHRVVVNADEPRLSIASFLLPCESVVIRAPDDPLKKPRMYRDFSYGEYHKTFWSRSLDVKEHCLELFKNV